VKQHRGWIEIHTEPGAGTRFELNIPVADAPVALEVTPVPNAPTMIAPVPAPRSAVRQRTVLLVDDESMVRDLGRAILTRAGYRVLTAEDGAEAVETFARQRTEIDIVVLDVTMPRMSGRDALRHILDIDPAARVLFSTGYSAEDLASVDGAIGLLSKPYRPQDLVTAVRAALAPQPVA
jgi:two-component system, cell cycle sensor histidine kinase and response regulator CckA